MADQEGNSTCAGFVRGGGPASEWHRGHGELKQAARAELVEAAWPRHSKDRELAIFADSRIDDRFPTAEEKVKAKAGLSQFGVWCGQVATASEQELAAVLAAEPTPAF